MLHARTESFPPQYRLANRLDIDLFKPFLFEVVPTGEVAYLEDGWVDSGHLQCKTGCVTAHFSDCLLHIDISAQMVAVDSLSVSLVRTFSNNDIMPDGLNPC